MKPNNNFSDIIDGIAEEQKIIAAYAFQARLYVLSKANRHTIKKRYASWIFSELKIEPPKKMGGLVTPINHSGIEIIYKHIVLYGDLLILHHPETKNPCVVDSAYNYTEYDIPAFEEQVLLGYAHETKKQMSDTTRDVIKKVASRSAKLGAGLTLMRIGANLKRNAILWNSQANLYSSVHTSMIKNRRSFQSKKAHQKALSQVLGKVGTYEDKAKYATKSSKLLGFISTKLIKSAISGPVAIMDILTPATAYPQNVTDYRKILFNDLVLEKLKEYCLKNNNFERIINQQYFEQG